MNTLLLKEKLDARKERIKQIFMWGYFMTLFISLIAGLLFVVFDFSWINLLFAIIGVIVFPFLLVFSLAISLGIVLSPFILIKWLTLKELLFQECNEVLLIKNKNKTILNVPLSDIVSCNFTRVDMYTGGYSSRPTFQGNDLGDELCITFLKNNKKKKVSLNLSFLSDKDLFQLHEFFSVIRKM